MATQIFSITQLGYDAAKAAAEGVPGPKHIWENLPGEIVVYTGLDMPEQPTQSVPDVINRRQFFRAIDAQGLTDAINALVAVASSAARIDFENATEIHRDYPLVQQIGDALGKSRQDIDDLFILAATF